MILTSITNLRRQLKNIDLAGKKGDNTNMTGSQTQTLLAIHEYMIANGYSPSYKDLGDILNITPSAAKKRVKALCEIGMISRLRGKQRTISINELGLLKITAEKLHELDELFFELMMMRSNNCCQYCSAVDELSIIRIYPETFPHMIYDPLNCFLLCGRCSYLHFSDDEDFEHWAHGKTNMEYLQLRANNGRPFIDINETKAIIQRFIKAKRYVLQVGKKGLN